MADFIIREYRDEDLPALAEHLKASVTGWPPGEFAGWDFTPESTRAELFRNRHLANWIAAHDEQIVGFMSFSLHFQEPDARYIPLLNAQPDFHGKGVGRDLLRMGVARAVEENARRLDLHTWAANTKAVPLYKKTGFFWRPRSEVHMYNFLPTVLRNPFVQKFLDGDDWYHRMRQDLSIAESDALVNGCNYQRYVFDKDGSTLEVWVDPSTSGVTAIISDDFEIRCEIRGERHIAGMTYPVDWHFVNRTGKPITVGIECTAPEGIDYKFEKEMQLSGENFFETLASLDPSLEPLSTDWWGYPLQCRVRIDDMALELAPGLRARPPFELDAALPPMLLVPGERREFAINLISAFAEPIKFVPRLHADGGIRITGPEGKPLDIPPQGGFAVTPDIMADDSPGEGFIDIGGTVNASGLEFAIKPLKVYARIAPKGHTVEIKDNNPMKICVANGVVRAIINRENGNVKFRHHDTGGLIIKLGGHSIGKPYSVEMDSTPHDVTVDENGPEALIHIRAASREFPGMALERTILIGPGAEFDTWQSLINESPDAFTGAVRSSMRRQGIRRVMIPLRSGIVDGDLPFLMIGVNAIPEKRDDFPEPWFAFKEPGGLTGVIAREFDAVAFNWWFSVPSFEWNVDSLPPSQRIDLPKITIVGDAPTVDYIRRKAMGDAPLVLDDCPRKQLNVRTKLFHAADESCILECRYERGTSLKGSTEATIPGGDVFTASSDKWNMDNPLKIEIPPGKLEPGINSIQYSTEVISRVESGTIPVVIAPPGAGLTVDESAEGGFRTFTVDNGAIRFKVSPDYCGTLWWLSTSGSDVNLLHTRFPEIAMHTWFNPWYGGIGIGSWQLEYRFHNSGFDAVPAEMQFHGHNWRGVRVDVSPLMQWSTLGMQVFYLTLPGAPVIMQLLRLNENLGAKRIFKLDGAMFIPPGGSKGETTLSAALGLDDDRVDIIRNTHGGEHCAWPWMSVTDEANGVTIGMIAPKSRLVLLDQAHEGKVPWWEEEIVTHPDRPVHRTFYYCVTDDPAKVRLLSDELRHWEVV